MNAPDLHYAFGLPPEKAIAYFESKGYAISWDWHDTWQEAHSQAFTVAKVGKLDILQEIRGAVQQAIDNGETFNDFRKNLEPKLKSMGWWGKSWVGDGQGAAQEVQLGSVSRLKTIYRNNLQTAYQAGHWKEQTDNADFQPYLQYDAVMDRRTRPEHAALNGKIFALTDPFWDTHYPPNGFNCRCGTTARSQYQIDSKGLTVSSSEGCLSEFDMPVGNTGDTAPVTVYTDPVTGRKSAPDVGWNYNPGTTSWKPDYSKYDADLLKAANKEKAPK